MTIPRSIWICILFAGLGGASVAAIGPDWPDLAGRSGPYSGILDADDAHAAAHDGFRITVQSVYDPAVLKIMSRLGIQYLDIQLWGFIQAQCKPQFERETAEGIRRGCVISASMRESILRDADAHLRAVKSNSNILGYWILDDYPAGDVSDVLKDLHSLVDRMNQESHTHKPTICGIGGSLDHRSEVNPRILADRTYIEASLQNLSPEGCDIVAPYFYGAAVRNDRSWIDWSMQDLMPWFMRKLRGRGFERPVLLPVVQAFFAGTRGGSTYFVQPSAADIDSQARGYCQFGVLAMMFFTWQAADAEHAYRDDADIRRGMKSAVESCRDMHMGEPQ